MVGPYVEGWYLKRGAFFFFQLGVSLSCLLVFMSAYLFPCHSLSLPFSAFLRCCLSPSLLSTP